MAQTAKSIDLRKQAKAALDAGNNRNVEINRRCTEEKRAMTPVELDEVRKHMTDATTLMQQVELEEQLDDMNKRAAAPVVPSSTPAGPDQPSPEQKLARKAFQSYLRGGVAAMTPEEIAASAWFAASNPEKRATVISPTDLTAGAYLMAPMELVKEIIRDLSNMVAIRQLARGLQVSGLGGIEIPVRKTKASSVAKGRIATPGTVPVWNARKLVPHWFTACLDIDRAWKIGAAAAGFNPDQIVREEMDEEWSDYEAGKLCTGTGADEPLGVFTDDANGIPASSRWFNAGLAVDNWLPVDARYVFGKLDERYRNASSWVMNNAVLIQAMIWLDGLGRPMNEVVMGPGGRFTLLGRPIYTDAYAPSTFTTGKALACLGDFSNYRILDVLDSWQITLDPYTQNRNDQDEIVVRRCFDGMPTKAEAFAIVKCA